MCAPPRRIFAGTVERTPTHHSRTLSKLTGCEIYLKFENLQFTASFKERGALNKLLSLTPEQRRRGVAAMSAGNHAQGGRLSRRPARHSRHHRDAGGHALQQGEAHQGLRRARDLDGATLTEGYVARAQIAGEPKASPSCIRTTIRRSSPAQGTVALELLEDAPELDTLVVPIGGGGLISGISIVAKAIKPEHRDLRRARRALYPSMYDALKEREPALRRADHRRRHRGEEAGRPHAQKSSGAIVKDILLVREDEIERALARPAGNREDGGGRRGRSGLRRRCRTIRISSAAARSASSSPAATSTCGCCRT